MNQTNKKPLRLEDVDQLDSLYINTRYNGSVNDYEQFKSYVEMYVKMDYDVDYYNDKLNELKTKYEKNR